MTMISNVRIALRALRVHKLRGLLTLLGIIIGVSEVIIMAAMVSGAQNRIGGQIQRLGSNLIVVIPGTTTAGGIRLPPGSQLTITEDDAWAMQRELWVVERTAPTTRTPARVVHGNLNWSTAMQGVTPEFFDVREWPVVAGKPLEPQDVEGSAKVALLGQTVVRNLFGDADPLGREVRIQRVPFTVIGVLKSKGQTAWGEDFDDVVVVPLTTAKQKVIGMGPPNVRAVTSIWIRVRDGIPMDYAERQIRDLLRQRHRLQASQDDDFWVRNLVEALELLAQASGVMTLLFIGVGVVSLIVGGIGITNMMLVSVTERTREIGLRMAVGARRNDILVQFLTEAVALALIGGVLGVVVGVGVSYTIALVVSWPPLVTGDVVVLAFLVAGAVGVFFGLYPARRASRLSPIDALRFE